MDLYKKTAKQLVDKYLDKAYIQDESNFSFNLENKYEIVRFQNFIGLKSLRKI